MQTRPFLLFVTALLGLCGSGCAHRHTAAGALDRGRGAALFAKNCSACHGAAGTVHIGPALAGVGHRLSLERITATIEDPDPPMPKLYPSVLTEEDVDDIAAYVKNL